MSLPSRADAALIARGTMLLLLSELVFTGLGALVKHLAPHYSNAQIVFFRNLFALLILLPYLLARGKLIFKADKLRFHFLRSTTGITSMYLYFYCLGVLPLGEVTLLAQTAPIGARLFANSSKAARSSSPSMPHDRPEVSRTCTSAAASVSWSPKKSATKGA